MGNHADGSAPLPDEHAQEEAKIERAQIKRAQIKLKKEFEAVMLKFPNEPNDEEILVGDITALQELVKKTGGLPLGIRKEELYKVIRSKKAKGYWPVKAEIA